jgi:hypothetical protein
MRPYLRPYAFKAIEHVGAPNGISFRWGRVPCGSKLEYRYDIRLTFKFNNVSYKVGICLEKDAKPLDDEDADYDHGC